MPRIILTALFAAAAAAVLSAQGGEAPCKSYQACLAKAQTRRWTELADTIQKSAATLRRLREALRAAEKSGDTAQASRLRALEPLVLADWEDKKALAATLAGGDYRRFLLERAVDIEERMTEAQTAFDRKLEQFRKLNQALQQQNDSEVRQLEALAHAEQHAANALLWDSSMGLLGGTMEKFRHSGAPAWLDMKKAEESYLDLKKIDAAKPAAEGHLSTAAAKAGLMVWSSIAPKALAASLAEVEAVASVIEVSGGLIDLALVHAHFEEAELRQSRILSLQKVYQLEIVRLKAVVDLQKAERERAREAIARQAAFEEQVLAIQKEVAQ
jgi:hypothetical protein